MTNDDDRRAVDVFHRASMSALLSTDMNSDELINQAHGLLCQAFTAHRLAAFKAGQEAKGQQISEGLDDLGEALFYLSDKLRGCGFMSDDANHAEYERVVVAYHALADQVPGVPFRFDTPDPLCTDCLGTGLTLHTERICSCDEGAELRRITTKGDDR